MEITADAVRKVVIVEASPERAFEVFTAGFDRWWPRSHHTGDGDLIEAVIEPSAGGRWFARTTVGEEDWGRVLVWDPPHRLVLDWQLDASFQYDPDLHTDVEVRFAAEDPGRTRVEFEHRRLEAYGDRAADMAARLSAAGGWPTIMDGYSAAV